MPVSHIHVRRSLRDSKQIAKVTMRAALRIGGKIRARYVESLRSGRPFKMRPYIVEQLQGIMVNSQLASHLAGYRRLFLIRKQTPALMKRFLEQQENIQIAASNQLCLSELSDTLAVLQKKTKLDLDELQRKYNTRALQILNDTSKEIQEALDKTFEELVGEGAHVAEAVRRLSAKFDELGLSPAKPHRLETIYRTQMQLAFSAGRWQAEQAPEIQEILWGYKYVTVGDDRVRDEHAALEGVTLPKDDPFWNRFYPPNGWNCRCYAIPIFEQREIVRPPDADENGDPIKPDKGFDFNPGKVFDTGNDKSAAVLPTQAKNRIANFSNKINLPNLTEDELAAVANGLERGLSDFPELKLKNIEEVDKRWQKGDSEVDNLFGHGFGTISMSIVPVREWANLDGQKRISDLMSTRTLQIRLIDNKLQTETDKKRITELKVARKEWEVTTRGQAADLAESPALRIAVGIAHETAHFIDDGRIKFGDELHKRGVTNLDMFHVSTYAASHPAEGFAEVHALMKTGLSYGVPQKIQEAYLAAIEAADKSKK